jgi:hypothetical protein
LALSDDGSGKGAGMVACVAERVFLEHDKDTVDYEKVNKILID